MSGKPYKWCPKCKSDRDLPDRFCWLCGAELVAGGRPKCLACGYDLDESTRHAQFCPRCGEPAPKR